MQMTPAEFRAARESIGLTQGDLAEALCVSRRTIASIEAGQSEKPRLYELALMGLIAVHKSPPE